MLKVAGDALGQLSTFFHALMSEPLMSVHARAITLGLICMVHDDADGQPSAPFAKSNGISN